MTALNDDIIKADRRGRLRYTPEQREVLVQACQSSGLTTPRFAALHGVKYQTLAAWLHGHKRGPNPQRPRLPLPEPLLLVPAELEDPMPSNPPGTLEVSFPGGARLSISSPGQAALAASLIRELETLRPC